MYTTDYRTDASNERSGIINTERYVHYRSLDRCFSLKIRYNKHREICTLQITGQMLLIKDRGLYTTDHWTDASHERSGLINTERYVH